MNTLLAICLSATLLLGACSSIKGHKITIKRPNKDDQVALQIDHARALYDMGEIDASIANLSTLVDKGAYTAAHDEAYELLIAWLLSSNRYEEAKRYASYFLVHHQKSQSANRIVELFRGHDTHLSAQEEHTPLLKIEDVEEETLEIVIPEEGEHHSQKLEVRDRALGILLPLSGPFAAFGKKALAAMSVGLQIPLIVSDKKISAFENSGLKVLVADTAGDPEQTRLLVDTLAQKYRVALMIGEITTDASIIASQRCALYQIPLLTLSRHPLARDMGKYIFGFNLSQAQETRALVAYAIKRGHKRFAIMYPRHNYGITMADAFYHEVLAQGGEIRGLEAYDAHETTFSEPIKKLVGLHFPQARPEYAECEKNKALILKKGVKNCKEALNPIVDFEALFIPEFKKLPLIAQALDNADILITNEEAAKRSFSRVTNITDGHVLQLLGPNSWHDQELITRLGSKANGALFVDAVDFNNEALSAFKNAVNPRALEPLTSLEIFAHDAAKLAASVLLNEKKGDRAESIRHKLAHYKGTIGLLPKLSFNPANELIAAMLGFEINNGRSAVITLD